MNNELVNDIEDDSQFKKYFELSNINFYKYVKNQILLIIKNGLSYKTKVQEIEAYIFETNPNIETSQFPVFQPVDCLLVAILVTKVSF